MTSEHQTRSLHYFHVYAVKHRIDLATCSNEVPQPDIDSMNFEDVLPSHEDEAILHNNFAHLIGQVLRKHIPFFDAFGSGLGKHIYHHHSDAMSAKSEVVKYRKHCVWENVDCHYNAMYRFPWASC